MKVFFAVQIFLALFLLGLSLVKEVNQDEVIYNKLIHKQQLKLSEDMHYIKKEEINLKAFGVISSFTTLYVNSNNENSTILLINGNKGFTFTCNQDLLYCKLTNTIVTAEGVLLETGWLSPDGKFLVLGGAGPTTNQVYIYQRNKDNVYLPTPSTIKDFTKKINSLRITNNGKEMVGGGQDETLRIYRFNESQPSKFTLSQSFNIGKNIQRVSTLIFDQNHSYIFCAYGSLVDVFKKNSSGLYENTTNTLGVATDEPIETTACPFKTDSETNIVYAQGGMEGTVRIYQYTPILKKIINVQNITGLNNIISLDFSSNGSFLVVGSHNFETYVYQKTYLKSGALFYTIYETIKVSEDFSNFAKVARLLPNAGSLVTGNDDLKLRIYKFCQCSSGEYFSFGECYKTSSIGLYIGISIGALLVIGTLIVVLICRKKICKRIPDQNKELLSPEQPNVINDSCSDYSEKEKNIENNKGKNQINLKSNKQKVEIINK